MPLDAAEDGQFYIGPGLSVNIYAKNDAGALRRGLTWACGLTFELEDGTIEAPGEARSAKPRALTAGSGPDANFRPRMFGVL